MSTLCNDLSLWGVVAVVPNVLMMEVSKLKLMVKNGRIANFDQSLTKSEFVGILLGFVRTP